MQHGKPGQFVANLHLQTAFCHTHVLQKQGIDTGIGQVSDHDECVFKLIIIDYRIDRHMDFAPKQMGITA